MVLAPHCYYDEDVMVLRHSNYKKCVFVPKHELKYEVIGDIIVDELINSGNYFNFKHATAKGQELLTKYFHESVIKNIMAIQPCLSTKYTCLAKIDKRFCIVDDDVSYKIPFPYINVKRVTFLYDNFGVRNEVEIKCFISL